MEKAYKPTNFEDKIYDYWEQNGHFQAKDNSPKPSFTIPLPPPNVTGALHNGHALVATLEDTLIRWKRMSGYNTLWLPGVDHAGIATQMVVERELAKEKTTRHQIGRDAFLKRVWEWKDKHGGIINRQLRKLGSSPDWTRARFTMDPGFVKAVRKVFVQLYKENLIYRGTRITSRCTRCETVLSDLEVVMTERKSNLWHIRYFSEDKSKHVVIATSRPETLLGDTAVAVNPEDERYKNFIGTTLVLPLLGRKIPVIADSYVDKEFGTGALKVTPAHDFNDYEIGKKHNLPMITIINNKGKLNENAQTYAGLTVAEARERVIADLKEQELLEKIEEVTQQVGLCQRCESVVEPLVSDQWFMKMKPMAEKAILAAKKGETLTLDEVDKCSDAFKIVPETWMNTYYHWMENIRDWCVSRQLWWGHRIPAFYCEECSHIEVSETDLNSCVKCNSKKICQDEDVLDTWFSAGLWPFVTLGWPEKTPAYQTFYPTSVLETGFDILFFWVARMLMMGMHFNDGKVPFTRIYLHAMVRDEKGQKMSKTKGNVIDPLDLIKDYGADAFRFTLLAMSGQGRDIRLSLDRVEGYQAFCNKIWNASRYVLSRLGAVVAEGITDTTAAVADFNTLTKGLPIQDWLQKNHSKLHPVNRWILSRLDTAAERINSNLDTFKMGSAAQEVYSFIWHEYCDWYIEFSKELLKKPEYIEQTQICLIYTLREMLALAHPFIPFITEEIFKNIPKLPGDYSEALIIAPYPNAVVNGEKINKTNFNDSVADSTIAQWKEIIEKIRIFRGENGISPKARPTATYDFESAENVKDLETGILLISTLSQLGSLVKETGTLKGKADTAEILCGPIKVYIPLRGLIDVEEELKRLNKEKEKALADIAFVSKKLAREDFISRAPKELVEVEKLKLETLKAQVSSIEQSMIKLNSLK